MKFKFPILIVMTWLAMAVVVACSGAGSRITGPRSRCGACHLVPDAHSVSAVRWAEVKGNHVERLHLSAAMIELLELELLSP